MKKNKEAGKKLRQWLDDQQFKRKKIAMQLGIEATTFSNLLNGAFVPGLKLAVMIEIVTDGYVRCREWVENSVESNPKKN